MLQRARLITADQFARMPGDGSRHELVKGRVIAMPQPKLLHGVCATRICRAVADHVERYGLGIALTQAGFKLESNPDTVRGPDASFIAKHRIDDSLLDRFFDGAPDLAIEVVSPGDRASEVARKVREYLAAGASAVWVVHPKKRTVTVYHRERSVRVLGERDTLTEPDLLPGFSYPLSALFAPVRRAKG